MSVAEKTSNCLTALLEEKERGGVSGRLYVVVVDVVEETFIRPSMNLRVWGGGGGGLDVDVGEETPSSPTMLLEEEEGGGGGSCDEWRQQLRLLTGQSQTGSGSVCCQLWPIPGILITICSLFYGRGVSSLAAAAVGSGSPSRPAIPVPRLTQPATAASTASVGIR